LDTFQIEKFQTKITKPKQNASSQVSFDE
jgi:hypothetical protein